MAVRKDYLLRIIDEFFKFLARILKLKAEKDYEQAFQLIDEASLTLLKRDLNELIEKDGEIESVIEEKSLTLDQIEVLAELLKVKADINLELSNNFTAINLYTKSLYLLNYVHTASKNFSTSRVDKISEINLVLMGLKV